MAMLNILTPLEEIVAYKQLVGIGEARGKAEGQREEGAADPATPPSAPFWFPHRGAEAQLAAASREQLEGASDQILDVESLKSLLERRPNGSIGCTEDESRTRLVVHSRLGMPVNQALLEE